MILQILAAAATAAAGDQATVAALDVAYQAAVKANDAAAMDRILHPDFVLVLGTGDVVSREALLDSARRKTAVYELQDETPGSQTVRVYGDTAVVTAKLHLKYTSAGKAADRTLWFSDTYVRTPGGWRYAFGQASTALPAS
jgi:ketosteroid isomerase-like protein